MAILNSRPLAIRTRGLAILDSSTSRHSRNHCFIAQVMPEQHNYHLILALYLQPSDESERIAILRAARTRSLASGASSDVFSGTTSRLFFLPRCTGEPLSRFCTSNAFGTCHCQSVSVNFQFFCKPGRKNWSRAPDSVTQPQTCTHQSWLR